MKNKLAIWFESLRLKYFLKKNQPKIKEGEQNNNIYVLQDDGLIRYNSVISPELEEEKDPDINNNNFITTKKSGKPHNRCYMIVEDINDVNR